MRREEVEADINAKLRLLGLPSDYQLHRVSDGLATPHVEGDVAPFNWVVSERGEELERRVGLSGEEVVFLAVNLSVWIFSLNEMARTQKSRRDSRWTFMDLHIRMMRSIRPDWGARVTKHYATVLERSPLTVDEQENFRLLALPTAKDSLR